MLRGFIKVMTSGRKRVGYECELSDKISGGFPLSTPRRCSERRQSNDDRSNPAYMENAYCMPNFKNLNLWEILLLMVAKRERDLLLDKLCKHCKRIELLQFPYQWNLFFVTH